MSESIITTFEAICIIQFSMLATLMLSESFTSIKRSLLSSFSSAAATKQAKILSLQPSVEKTVERRFKVAS